MSKLRSYNEIDKKNRCLNQYVWRCRVRTQDDSHDVECGILKNSFFENAHVPLRNLVILIYEWSFETPVEKAATRAGINIKNCIEWYKELRRLCSAKINTLNLAFGGENSIVQIDESKFMKLKSNRGNPTQNVRRKYWAFALSDSLTNQVYIKLVSNRKQQTLFPIIRSIVVPNSIIWSDEFSTYTGGPNYSENMPTPLALLGPYTHHVVNHSLYFKDPLTGVHTNNIEATWSAAKRKFKSMNGTNRSLVQSYLDEYMCRRNFLSNDDIFLSVIELIQESVVNN